jgi:phosphoesterase RecJ-like protein
MIEQIVNQFTKCRTVLVASHVNPDGDAVGALLALGLALKTMNKGVCIYNQSAIPAVYRFLPSVSTIGQTVALPLEYDAVVVLDCGSIERLGKIAPDVRNAQILINIDHHMTNTRFGHKQLIDPNACATAEIVYRLIKALPVKIDRAMAMAIYTGILTDTGSFRFSNTNKSAFAICAEMIECGANPYEVAQHVYGHYSLGRIKLLNLALDSLEISPNGKMSIMSLTQDMMDNTGTQDEDIDGIINYARRIEDVKIAALIHEIAGNGRDRRQYHVSLRSDGSVNVAHIAAYFGGGGHANAAGFSAEATLPELKNKIVQLSENAPDACNIN